MRCTSPTTHSVSSTHVSALPASCPDRWRRLLALTALVAVVPGCDASNERTAALLPPQALTAAQCDHYQVDGRVTICHATGSATNPLVVLRISELACINTHADHPNDRIAVDGSCGPEACLPVDAPCDPTVPCCDGLACVAGVCSDVDECLLDNGGCEQACSNTVGGFACSCDNGYALQPDGWSCTDVCDPVATPFGGGTGTTLDPFRICSRVHLANVGTASAANFRQVVDLDLGDAPFPPVGSDTVGLAGDYDGQGHVIRNLTWHDEVTTGTVALFRSIGVTGRVHDLHLIDVDLKGNNLVGALVGFNWGSIRDVSVSGSVSARGCVGGVAAKQEKLGDTDPEITRATVVATIFSAATGDRIINVEPASAEKDDCGAAGVVSTLIGGVVDGCEVDADIRYDPAGPGHAVPWTWAGGIAGYARRNSLIQNCTTYGSVTGKYQVGGIVGGFEGNAAARGIVDSTSFAEVHGEYRVGGLAGLMRKPTIRSWAFGDVVGDSAVGGLIGDHLADRVSASFAAGEVSGRTLVGGLIGWQENWDGNSLVEDSYAVGSVFVTTDGAAGGLVGWADGIVERCYAAAPAVAGSTNGFAFTGGGSAPITNSYFHDNGAVPAQTVPGVSGLSSASMQQSSSFAGFAFGTTWVMPSLNPLSPGSLRMPVLAWQCGRSGVVCP